MMLRAIAVLLVLAALAGCKSSGEKSDVPQDPFEQSLNVEERELYWHQRGADATKAIWEKFRLSDDTPLIGDSVRGRLPSYAFSTHAFNLLLDNVSIFWRKDRAAEAVSAFFYDFTKVYPDRSANCSNEEVLRWAIVCTRASRVTGNKVYLEEARTLYDSLWQTQVDNALDGGMWHRSDEKVSKSAAANLCAVVAALNLYHATQDIKYLLQGARLYKWTEKCLFDKTTGAINPAIDADGVHSAVAESVGDVGVFICASMRLYRATGKGAYLANAKKAADRLVGSSAAIRVAENSEESLANGVAMRYLAELASRPGCERYREYILSNARSAWTSRRLSDGLNGPDWAKVPLATDSVKPQTALSAAILYFAASRACR